MFGIGTTELVIVGFIVFILFGSRLPKSWGRSAWGLGNSSTD